MSLGPIDLLELRLNRGLSSRDAAAEIGVSQATLLNVENGKRPKAVRDAKAIADFYGYRVTDIWPIERAAA